MSLNANNGRHAPGRSAHRPTGTRLDRRTTARTPAGEIDLLAMRLDALVVAVDRGGEDERADLFQRIEDLLRASASPERPR